MPLFQTYRHKQANGFLLKSMLVVFVFLHSSVIKSQINLIENGDFEEYQLPLSPQKDIGWQYLYKNWITCKGWYAGNPKAVGGGINFDSCLCASQSNDICQNQYFNNFHNYTDSIRTFKYSNNNIKFCECDRNLCNLTKQLVGKVMNKGGITGEWSVSDSIYSIFPNYKSRTYFGTKLKQKLQYGKTYKLTFIYDNAQSNSKDLGILFSTYKVQQQNNEVIKLKPHYQKNEFEDYPGFHPTLFRNADYTFVADSAHEYMTIGCFLENHEIHRKWFPSWSGGFPFHNFRSIYYLDNFELKEVLLAPQIKGDSFICKPQQVKLYSNSGFNTLWYIKGNPNVIHEGDSLSYFINQTTTFYATHDGFKDSFTVRMVDAPAKVLKDTFFFTGNSYTAVYPNNNFRFQWNNNPSDTLASKTFNTEGLQILRLKSPENCVYYDSFYLKEINPNFNIVGDTVVCQFAAYNTAIDIPKQADWYINHQLVHQGNSLQHTFNTNGNHAIKVCYDTMGYQICDSINLKVIEMPQSNLAKDTQFCSNNPPELCPVITPVSTVFSWWDNSNTPCKTITNSGIYTLSLNNEGCLKTDTLLALSLPIPQFRIIQNDTPCLDGNHFTLLQIMPDTFKSYQWQPSGETVSALNINDTSSHFITVTAHNNCSNTQSYKPINNCKMTLFMPNTFTPNKDGRNDVLKIQGHYIQNATMQIYTRWGELVFQSDDINQGWDGTYKGETVQEGIYLVKLKLTSMPQLNGQTPHAYYELMLNVLR